MGKSNTYISFSFLFFPLFFFSLFLFKLFTSCISKTNRPTCSIIYTNDICSCPQSHGFYFGTITEISNRSGAEHGRSSGRVLQHHFEAMAWMDFISCFQSSNIIPCLNASILYQNHLFFFISVALWGQLVQSIKLESIQEFLFLLRAPTSELVMSAITHSLGLSFFKLVFN
jgi:hypothetical protein